MLKEGREEGRKEGRMVKGRKRWNEGRKRYQELTNGFSKPCYLSSPPEIGYVQ
jgi:hypothetical protein